MSQPNQELPSYHVVDVTHASRMLVLLALALPLAGDISAADSYNSSTPQKHWSFVPAVPVAPPPGSNGTATDKVGAVVILDRESLLRRWAKDGCEGNSGCCKD